MTDQSRARGSDERYVSLDAIRGVAVMGILLLNAFLFTMPDAAVINPRAWGGERPIDLGLWAINFVLFDGRMRGLFTLLFGASMALVVARANAKGGNGLSVHLRRMFWLLLFGLAHHLFVWEGDILVHYAILGSIAYLFLSTSNFWFRPLSNRALRRWAVGLLVASFLWHALATLGFYALRAEANAPGASAQDRARYEQVVTDLAKPGGGDVREDARLLTSDYLTILRHRGGEMDDAIPNVLGFFGLETLGLMVLGILLLRNGFLTGDWEARRYRAAAWWGYGLGLPPLVLLAAWNWSQGFPALDTFATWFSWAEPFRYPVLIGHAAIAMLLLRRRSASALVLRTAAVGRAAFTNYLGTSIVMTTLFYGYGLGLYGKVGRAEVYLFILGVWALMLLWSKPWLDRFQYGPFEWLWRSLARGQAQPIRRVEA